MDVNVKHRLTARFARVDYRAVAGFGDTFLVGDLGREPHQMAENGFVALPGVVQRFDVFFGNDQDVRRGLRIDVAKGVGRCVLIDFGRGNLALDDVAK